MKFIFLIILITAITMVGLNNKSKNKWVEVDGGSWIPKNETIEKIKIQIESIVQFQAKDQGLVLQEWDKYIFQYQGQEEQGRKFIFINALRNEDNKWKLNKQMIITLDGGTRYFNVKYDLEKNQFFDLYINGGA